MPGNLVEVPKGEPLDLGWLLRVVQPAGSRPAPRTVGPSASDAQRPILPPASREVIEEALATFRLRGPAISGQGGNSHTYAVLAEIANDLAMTWAEAREPALEWDASNVPPWGEEALAELFRNAQKYATKPYGCRRTLDTPTVARAMLVDWQAGPDPKDPAELARRLRALQWSDPGERERFEIDAMNATGLSKTGLSLPKATIRRPSVEIVGAEPWLDRAESGAPIPNINNVVDALERDHRPIWFDPFLQQIQIDDATGKRRNWTDADDLRLTHAFQQRGLTRVAVKTVNEAVQTYAHRHQRNTLVEWLKGLEWDRKERLEGFLARAFGALDSPYTRAASGNFWRALVARLLHPGCKVDNMIVLEGGQGLGKSRALREIAGDDYFAETFESPAAKDFYQGLHGKSLVEVAEMDAFGRADVAAIKRAMSTQVDHYRPSYGRTAQAFPRQGIFAGTTNRDDWARDDTGGRRFWPVRCTAIDLNYIGANRDQLYAEAVAAVQAGATWWEMPAAATAAEQEARRQDHPWEAVLAAHLADVSETEITELLRHPLGIDPGRMDKGAQMQAAAVLRRLGFAKVDGRRNGHKAKVWRRLPGGNAGGNAQPAEVPTAVPTFPPSHP